MLSNLRRSAVGALRRLLVPPGDPERECQRVLGDRFRVGRDTHLSEFRLTVREPADCNLIVGDSSNIECSITLERKGASVTIGSRSHVGGGTVISAATLVEIGDDVMVAFDSLIMDHDSHSLDYEQRQHALRDWMSGSFAWEGVAIAPVHLKNKCWIGAHAIILRGVTIGEGSVVAAGSVVTRSVPDWTLVGGNPARPIRALTPPGGQELAVPNSARL
jgi:galactoside O-acetyltransferase